MTAHRIIFLTGLPGVGKTTLGRHIADRLGVPFVDTDDIVVAGLGMSIDRIFKKHGEAVFREAERAVVEELCKHTDAPRIVALGGGAMKSAENREHLLSSGIVVYLTCSVRELCRRSLEDTSRPLLNSTPRRGETPRQARIRLLTQLKKQREPFYRKAHGSMSTTEGSIAGQGKQLMKLIERLHEFN